MFNPISASQNIRDEFIGYISTLFHISDRTYAERFVEALQAEEVITKGPYLDINNAYKTGKSIQELIDAGELSPLFRDLEGAIPDGEKELQLNRNLYMHQEVAIRKANQNQNLVVATGTSSGKTECFIIPIINHLLRERETGVLTSGVRAILIYPMNALANDQMKRLRSLLKSYPDITFGVYNSSTKHDEKSALAAYQYINKDDPLPNERLSRSKMRDMPPHILVTNYAMLEHMMLRPKDDYVFSGAKLRFLVLDEAHIYRGATGMETSLLLKRVKARIDNPAGVLHILTSATLGGEDSEIVNFAETLCNAHFEEQSIVRSEEIVPGYVQPEVDVPYSMFAEIADPSRPLDEIARQYGYPIPAGQTEKEYLYDLCLNARAYRCLRAVAEGPMTLPNLTREMKQHMEITEQDIVNIIRAAVQAEKNKLVLMKARYHMFAKALEGAYITLDDSRQLMLNRTQTVQIKDQEWKVFEAAVCEDCGSLALAGKMDESKLEFANGSFDWQIQYFMLADGNGAEERKKIQKNDYIVCRRCGAIVHESMQHSLPCDHGRSSYIRVQQAVKNTSNEGKCPCCRIGTLKLFYLNYSAATAVLGTSLFEELPELQKVIKKRPEKKQSLFKSAKTSPVVEYTEGKRQFLAFSDSRSEAAFFASYMEASYQDFLRRRGVWHIVEKYRDNMAQRPWEIEDFVNALAAYFDENRTFARPGDTGKANLTAVSERNAWIAVMNEMVNARRSTSLASMGVLRFHYKGNDHELVQGAVNDYGLTEESAEALLDLLVMDIVYHGAIKGSYDLNGADREFIYFTTLPKGVVKNKVAEDEEAKTEAKDSTEAAKKPAASIMGWACDARKEGGFYPNGRLKRVMQAFGLNEADANAFLQAYWDEILADDLFRPGKGEKYYYFTTDRFTISAGMGAAPVYQCDTCGRITMMNCRDMCAAIRCGGHLKPIGFQELIGNNHYAKLYASQMMKPMHIKEHTAQLGRAEQQSYQDMFVNKDINALSCSTTFEMGVDVGDLETVYLRGMPPSPANYVQRAGRAGRSRNAAAFSLTYAKLGSHDFTYYKNPEDMITGKIGVPVFTVRNEKVILRHIFAVALSYFFSIHKNIYNNNNADTLLNRDGWEQFCSFLDQKPPLLKTLLEKSIPDEMHQAMGIDDFSWVEKLTGDDGIMTVAVRTFRETVSWYEQKVEELGKAGNYTDAALVMQQLKEFRKGKDDEQGKNELIEFLVRNNVLPKYGFPVDTVELHQNSEHKKDLRMMRDLQIAVAEYAPDSEVVADGRLYTSRYIRRSPQAGGQNWETAYVAKCPNLSCFTWNHRVRQPTESEIPCVSCHSPIKKDLWKKAIEPRMGFIAESYSKRVPMKKPEKAFRGDDYYIGDSERQIIHKLSFETEKGNKYQMETSVNDSLMVVCNNDFFVCETCGYAFSTAEGGEETLEHPHRTSFNEECTETLKRNKLCHVFKTDVVRITFKTTQASIENVMLSVMYGLLEAISAVLDIERNDIKGCLHKTSGSSGIIYSLVLYDAVAGGAGHVRRVVTEDGTVFQQIIEKAIEITKNCDCSPSCYTCLRNYYNQKIHNRLNREYVYDFLENFKGQVTQISEQEFGS